MPQIIVTADRGDEAPVLLRERVNTSDFESAHFGRHLVERLGWAVEDARELETSEPVHDADIDGPGHDAPRSEAETGPPTPEADAQPPASVVTTAS